MHNLIQKCKNLAPILIIIFLANTLPVLSIDKPQARVSNPNCDFGYVPQKSKVSHIFYLSNTGTAPLTVSEIKSGCSCTSISKIEKPIAPGDSAAITVTFNSGRYYKSVKKTTEVHTDNPDSSIFYLNIAAKVYKKNETAGDISVKPQKMIFKINNNGLITEIDSLEISNNSPDSVAINVLHISEIIINQIDIPRSIKPNATINPVIQVTKEFLSDKLKGESIIFSFVGRDTTIVSVPIEIKK